MNIPFIDLVAQYNSIKGEIDEAIQNTLRKGQFILGSEVKALEEEMSSYCGTGYAVGVASGTDALHLALLALEIGQNDEVITTPFTFIATSEAITKCGATPVFADIEPRTLNINTKEIENKITAKTKAIIPVHLYGQPADMDTVLQIANEHGIKVIEDCAQALGAEYNGRKVGSIGDAGCLSFFPSKNLGAYGDGGMVITSDSQIAENVKILRVHGAYGAYHHVAHGFNSRLDALQAAILRVKLRYLEQWNEKRRIIASLYDGQLSRMNGIEPLYVEQYVKSSYNYYTIRIKDPKIDRDGLRQHLESSGILTMVYYPLSLHLQEVYKNLGYKFGDFPQSENAQETVLSLPMYPELSEYQIENIVKDITVFLRKLN